VRGCELGARVSIAPVPHLPGIDVIPRSHGVLDRSTNLPHSCERENQWLEEGPYYIDTTMVPRGGARRRKSMEPKALANLNGTLVRTPMRSTSNPMPQRQVQTAPNTPVNSRGSRRASSLWMRTPDDESEDNNSPWHGADSSFDQDEDEDEGSDWGASMLMLTPVPKTPAPEAIARYAAAVTPGSESEPGTPENDDSGIEQAREVLLMRTCPPKANEYRDLGKGVLSKEKDEGVLMRLMAARRKSLQFAPKVGSPLARTWN
jgi:hypothetical protein